MPAPAESPPRKRFHDLDALRACAMLPGVLLHATFHTIPWRYFDRPVLPGGPNVRALPCFHGVQLIHGLRMPVFFLPGGFFCALFWQRRGLLLLAWTREVRYTWFGTLLNGKRERNEAERVSTPPGSPAPL